jgi:hypothetical protein
MPRIAGGAASTDAEMIGFTPRDAAVVRGRGLRSTIMVSFSWRVSWCAELLLSTVEQMWNSQVNPRFPGERAHRRTVDRRPEVLQ